MAQTLGKKQKSKSELHVSGCEWRHCLLTLCASRVRASEFDEEEFASNLETEDGIYEETADGLVKTSTKPGQKAATKKKQPETVPQTGDQLST